MSDAVMVAIWQGAGVPGDALATAEAAGQVVARAAAAGARLVIFPEGYLTGYFLPGLKPGALDAVEPALARVGASARAHGVNVIIGTHTQEGGVLRNSAVAFDAAGAEAGRYHKRALFGDWEKATFAPGAEPLRLTLAGLKLGVLICYDVEFPELVRAEAQAGAELVVVCTALMAPFERVARMIVPVRAMENQVFLAYANRSGSEGSGAARLDFLGLSSLRGPTGEDLASAGAGPELIMAPISARAIGAARADDSYLADLALLDRGTTAASFASRA